MLLSEPFRSFQCESDSSYLARPPATMRHNEQVVEDQGIEDFCRLDWTFLRVCQQLDIRRRFW